MKNIVLILILFMFAACSSDQDFLSEQVDDFLTPENSYLSQPQLETAMNALYSNLQKVYMSNSYGENGKFWIKGLGTDVACDPTGDTKILNDWSLLNSHSGMSRYFWELQYDFIKNSNVILESTNNEEIKWKSEEAKNAIIAEARFFRGYAYRNLASVFGGVPIIREPITEPRRDFVRDSREECYQFAKEDLEYARQYLPVYQEKPGRVVRAAADHVLSEILIDLKDYDGAIAAATRVIDGTDGEYELMKERFGTRADEAGRNVYWDMFRMGNQNYADGNKESILAAQYEYNTPGSSFSSIERIMWPWLSIHAGYPSANDSLGRGAAFVRITNYTNYTIWEGAGSDYRSSEACIKRNYYIGPMGLNVGGTFLEAGTLITKENYFSSHLDSMRKVFPRYEKFGTEKHIDGIPDKGYIRDIYVMRLAETYLLRAEAYLGKSDKIKAAADINKVRNRSNAADVAAADVDMDYILDERARELFGEEFRAITLCRLGMLYERTKKYGYAPAQASVQPHNNLWPIPQTEIDRNLEGDLKQNDGY